MEGQSDARGKDAPGLRGWELTPLPEGSSGSEGTSSATNPLPGVTNPEIPFRASEDFQLVRFVNQGQSGEIWAAWQSTVGRVVAVKRLKQWAGVEATGSAASWENVLHEAYVLGQLEHPNILPVYEIGRSVDGSPLIAMELIKGRPWSDVLKEDFAALPALDLLGKHLPIFLKVLQAVAFAHSRGVVHRDLKPSQVMIGEYGEVMLADWGLALFLDDDPGELHGPLPVQRQTVRTARGRAGTPALMAPEQFDEMATRITPRTDIYLLGGVLYFLLTGSFPHHGASAAVAMGRAKEGHLESPQQRAPGREIPEELADLAMWALRPEPVRRPDNVRTLISRIEDYLTGASARRESERLTRSVTTDLVRLEQVFGERTPLPNTLGEGAGGYDELVECLNRLDTAAARWSANPELARVRDSALEIYAKSALSSGDLRLTGYLLRRMGPGPTRERLQGALNSAAERSQRLVLTRKLALSVAALLALVLVAGGLKYFRDLEVARLDLSSKRAQAEQARMKAEREQYFAGIRLAESFLADQRNVEATRVLFDIPQWPRDVEWGLLAAAASQDVFNIILATPPAGVLDAVFSPDGTEIATGDRNGDLMIWDARTGEKLRWGRIHRLGIWCVRWSPDGRSILTTSLDGVGAVVDSEAVTVRTFLVGHNGWLRGGAWSRDGRRVFTTSRDQSVRAWNAATGEELWRGECDHTGTYDVDVSPDGTLLAVSGFDQVALFDIETGRLVREFPPQPENNLSVRFSPNGRRLLTSCTDRFFRIYDVETTALQLEVNNQTSWPHVAIWTNDGSQFISGDDEGTFRFWDAQTGAMVATAGTLPNLYKLSLSPDGRRLITTSNDGAHLWDVETLLRAVPRPPDQFAPEEIASAYRLRAFRLPLEEGSFWIGSDGGWRAGDGPAYVPYRGALFAVDSFSRATSPEGKWEAMLSPQWQLTLRNNEDGSLTRMEEPAVLVEINNGGEWMVVGTRRGEFRLYALPITGSGLKLSSAPSVLSGDGAATIGHAAFSPDGSSLVVAERTGDVTLHEILPFKGRTPETRVVWKTVVDVGRVTVSGWRSDGELIGLGGSAARTALLYADTGKAGPVLEGHANGILSITFSTSGERVLTSSLDGTGRLWDVADGREVLKAFEQRGPAAVLNSGITPDGRFLWGLTIGRFMLAKPLFPITEVDAALRGAASPIDALERVKRSHSLGALPLPATVAARRIVTDPTR